MSPAKKSPAKSSATRSRPGKAAAAKSSSARAAATKSAAAKGKTAGTAVRKPTAKTAAKKTAVKKTPAKKTAVKKTAAKKTAAKKTAAKKTARKSPSAKKTAARKPPVKRSAARTRAPASTTSKSAERKAPAGSRSKPGDSSVSKTTSSRRPPRPVKLDTKTLNQIRATLESERDDLLRRQAELEQDSFDATQSDLTGEVGLDEDFADAGTATFERERDLSIRNNIRDLVDQITRALARISEGDYGNCERCGKPIDAARLRALPHANLCMDCKRKEERAR